VISNIKCLVCQNESADFFVRKNEWDLFRCQKCGLIFVFPIGPEFHDQTEKSGNNENWEATEETFSKYLEILERFQPGKGRLFDVGAATGVFIEMAQKKGWDASGIELLSHSTEVGDYQRKLRIAQGNFEEYQGGEECFDVISFWDVLEHFAHPDLAMQNAERLLKPGGILVINTPDISSFLAKLMGKRWHLLVPPSHLYCFNGENLQIFLEKYGFEIIYSGRVGKKFSLRNIFRLLAIWQKLKVWEKIYRYLLRSRLGAVKISINTRDNQFLIARKQS
jgi:SAM-dependent methyltransferase